VRLFRVLHFPDRKEKKWNQSGNKNRTGEIDKITLKKYSKSENKYDIID